MIMKKYAEKLMSILVITAMLLSVLPGAVIAAKEPSAENLPLVTAANINDEAVYILNSNFRAHPKTSSIFEGDVPNNLLWTEFSNRIDHVADYDKNSKTYKLDDKYYQLVIERPPHGPGNDHQATKIIPDNGIVGNINDNLADGDENTKHRYHGWVVGTDQLFEQDTDVEHQVGGYTVRLMRLKPTEEEINQGGEALMNCAERYEVNAKALKILNITYTLSDEDIQSGYRLKCPMENIAKEEITELAMEGDWITVVDPNIDASLVSEEPKKTVSYWKIVKDGQPGENVGNTIPAADKDGTDDNCITLQAVLEEPKSYTYEFQRDDDTDTAAFPTAPPASQEAPNPTAPPASYNELISAGGGSEKIEYEPTNTIKPLVLRLVNTGNQRSYIAA